MKKVLIVVAHPDDEVLGCGGTAARLAKEGCEVRVLILGEGITSRDAKRKAGKRQADIAGLKSDARTACSLVGIKMLYSYSFPDNRFDGVELLEIVKVVEQVKAEFAPDTIFTHYEGDLNIDHRIVYEAVITATRPVAGETVKDIYSFEVLSSTEWRYPSHFSPDIFFDITKTIDLKLKAMAVYKTELKAFPHPRSLDGIKINAKYWGMKAGMSFAEAFEAVRLLR